MTNIQVFQFETQDVRTMTVNDEPWFIAADVCETLDLTNPTVVVGRLDEDEKAKFNLGLPGGSTWAVNESGLYSMILASRKPEAKAFKRWITHEVIPSIRRTGSYTVETTEQLVARALIAAQGIIEQKDHHIAELTPRAEAWDELASAEGDYEVADAAKILARAGIETGRQRLFGQLEKFGWIFRGSLGKWRAKQTAVDSGYLVEKPQSHYHPRTGELVLDPPQVRVTLRGLERLRVRLGMGVVA